MILDTFLVLTNDKSVKFLAIMCNLIKKDHILPFI